MRTKRRFWLGLAAVAAVLIAAPVWAGPTPPAPVGASTTTVSYTTGSGPVSFSGDRLYNAVGPGDATQLGAAPNIRTFNSVNTFGRRTFVAGLGPQFAGALGPNESQIAHAFFKLPGAGLAGDYFPGITQDSMVTVEVSGIQFAQPVEVDDSTVMLHTLWADAQVGQFDPSGQYFNLHNHEIAADTFRDFDDFTTGGVFSDFPISNYVLSSTDLIVAITGEGTNELGLTVTFPYALLQHAEETGQVVPDGLPAPHGFLEPFHFHVEYVVTPEPATAVMCLLGAAGLLLRRRGTC